MAYHGPSIEIFDGFVRSFSSTRMESPCNDMQTMPVIRSLAHGQYVIGTFLNRNCLCCHPPVHFSIIVINKQYCYLRFVKAQISLDICPTMTGAFTVRMQEVYVHF